MKFTDMIRSLPAVRLETEYSTVCIDGRGGVCQYEDVRISLVMKETSLRISLLADQMPVKRIRLSWAYPMPAGVRILGDAWERGYGDLEWRGIVPERVMPWYMLLSGQDGTCGLGVRTGANALCFWRCDGTRIELCLDVRNGAEGVLLTGRTLQAAEVVWIDASAERSAYETAQALCRRMCDNPRLPKSCVYGSNNWYYAYGNSSREQILRDAALLREITEGNPVRPYLVIDDGWQVCREGYYNGGPWNAGNEQFGDMERLAKEIRNFGLRPGLWYRPLVTRERVPDECRLMRVQEKEFSVLDPSHPAVLRMAEEMTRTLAGWGYELLKHDFTTNDIFGRWGPDMGEMLTNDGWHFYDRSKTTAEIITELYRAIRRGAGEDTVLIGCNTLSHLSAGLFELQRTGDDTSGREWERTRKMGVNTLAFRMPQHNAFYACDADCVGVMPAIDWKLDREWLRLLAASGTPLFASIDPDSVTEEQKNDLKTAFQTALAVKTPAQPLNWQDTACPDRWLTQNGEENFSFPAIV